jgi:hypothetical protein
MPTRGSAGSRVEDGVEALTADESVRFAEIFRDAVRAAREENRRLGIPNVQVEEDGTLTEELPDGTVRPIRDL